MGYRLAVVPQPLPRAYRRQLQAEDVEKVDRILVEVGEAETPLTAAGATAAGDWARLRGIPAVGRGCAGAVRGSTPVGALLAKEARRARP
jgi:hypothetical protein